MTFVVLERQPCVNPSAIRDAQGFLPPRHSAWMEELEYEVAKEEANRISLSEDEIEFFLYKMRNGSIEDQRYRKMLIHTLVNKVYLYDDRLGIHFNAGSSRAIEVTAKLTDGEKPVKKKSSYGSTCAPPTVLRRSAERRFPYETTRHQTRFCSSIILSLQLSFVACRLHTEGESPVKVLKTARYDAWFKKLKNVSVKARINARIRRIELAGELVGDWKSVGEKVLELRIDTGPGYRLYCHMKGNEFILLLVGGDKSTQQSDIKKARELLEEWERQNGSKS